MQDGIVVDGLHHVSLPVTDLERSRAFYRDVLGLKEIARPNFDFAGAWFELGVGQLHLIVHPGPSQPTFRDGKSIDSRDIHFAIRVRNFDAAVEALRRVGYREDADDPFRRVRVSAHATAGFPQLFVLDPDRNVVELNAAALA